MQPVTQLPQSRRQVRDVLRAVESVPPISDSEVTCGPMTRPATLSSSATSSSNSTDFSSSSSSSSRLQLHHSSVADGAWQKHARHPGLTSGLVVYDCCSWTNSLYSYECWPGSTESMDRQYKGRSVSEVYGQQGCSGGDSGQREVETDRTTSSTVRKKRRIGLAHRPNQQILLQSTDRFSWSVLCYYSEQDWLLGFLWLLPILLGISVFTL